MKSRLIHILGAGPWQLPTIRLAREMGYRVLTTDGYPDRPGFLVADYYEQVDIVDFDKTLEAARRYRIDGVLCDTTDIGVPCAAYVAEQLGLPGAGFETARNFCDKGRMREQLCRAAIPTPSFRVVESLDEVYVAGHAIGYPIVIKPVDNQSGRGVTRVAEEHGIAEAFACAMDCSRQRRAIVERFLTGTELIVDSFSWRGEVRVLGIARKTQYPENPTISRSIDYPATLSDESMRAVVDVNRKSLAALGLRDGVSHAEYMLTDSTVYPLDVAARGGGVMIYTHVLPHLAGFNVNSAMIKYAMGEDLKIPFCPGERAASVSFFKFPVGALLGLDGLNEAGAVKGVAALHFNLQIGDAIGGLSNKDDRPGFLVTLGEAAEQVRANAAKARSMLKACVSGYDLPVSAQ